MKTINKKGLTLVEIIVATAIIGVIGVTFFTIFAGMFKNIAKGGNRAKEVFQAQKSIERELADRSGVDEWVTIKMPDGNELAVYGKFVEVDLQLTGSEAEDSIKVFVPNK